jgi:hypothetical protein
LENISNLPSLRLLLLMTIVVIKAVATIVVFRSFLFLPVVLKRIADVLKKLPPLATGS